MISDHILKPAHWYSCRKHCLELFSAPFTDALPLKAVEMVADSQRVEYSHLMGKISMLSFTFPIQIYFDKTWELGLTTRQHRGALSSWDSFFPLFPLPLYSHTGPWEGSCTKGKCAFSPARVGAVVGSEYLEAVKGFLTKRSKQQYKNGGCSNFSLLQVPRDGALPTLFNVCVFESNRRVSPGIEDQEAFNSLQIYISHSLF